MSSSLRFAIDAMGGDRAPGAAVQGAVRAVQQYDDVTLVLAGDPTLIAAELDAAGADEATRARLEIHDAPISVSADEDPVQAIRASDKVSARACAELLRRGHVSGVLTMGNTGAAVAAATLYAKRLSGVKRLGIAVPFPRPGGVTIVIDGGANPDARPIHLHQYALMAREYVKHALGCETPRTGILSIGEEEHKGNRLVAETWEVFRANPVPDFVGNVEPREFFDDRADVVVADGFVGNACLKAAEGMGEFVLSIVTRELGARDPELARDLALQIARRVDHSKYGGAPLLGLEGGYIIGHGRSGPEAYASGVGVLRTYANQSVGDRIVASLQPSAAQASTSASEQSTGSNEA